MTRNAPSNALSAGSKALTVLALLSLSAASQASSTPPLSSGTTSLTMTPPQQSKEGYRGIVQYVDIDNMMVHVSDLNQAASKDNEKHEFGMAIQPVDGTIKAAGELQRLWKTFQDKTRWRLQYGLNASLTPVPLAPSLPHDYYGSSCVIPIGEISNTLQRSLYGAKPIKDLPNPAANTDWDAAWNLSGFKFPGNVKAKTYPNDLDLKWYGAPIDLYQFRSVDRNEVCKTSSGGSYMRTPVDGLVGPRMSYTSQVKTPLGMTRMKIHDGEIKERIRLACGDVNKYYQQYLEASTKAIQNLPGGMFWSDTGGSLSTGGKKMALYQVAVSNLTGTSLASLQKLASDAGDPIAVAYLAGLAPSVAGGQDAATGSGKYEDLKRALPVTNPLEQTRLGYANIFQVWADLDIVRDPKPLTLWTTSYSCAPFGCSPDAVSIPVPGPNVVVIPEACAALPTPVTWPPTTNFGQVVYTVPRFHFRWLSVPEGHVIPDVTGKPLGFPTGGK